jgi:multiple sugar transport system permease protein
MSDWRRADAQNAIGFLLPALGLLAAFVVWPLLRAINWSFHDTDLLAPARQRWIGVEHYSDLIQDPRFRRAFGNTALFALLVVPLQTLAAFVIALWVNRPEPYWRWLRIVFFVPTVVAMPVLAVVWSLLYQPAEGAQMGLLNALLATAGLPPQGWLRDPQQALPAIALMSIWQGIGLQMVVFLAALQTRSQDSLEAALLDGANALQRTWYVTVPALRNTILFVVTVTTIFAFRLFVQPYLMTRGGPGDSTLSLIQAMYEMTFLEQDLGRACAAALLFLILVGVVTLIQRLLVREERA